MLELYITNYAGTMVSLYLLALYNFIASVNCRTNIAKSARPRNTAGGTTATRTTIERKLTVTDTPFDVNDQKSPTKINILKDDSFLRLLQQNEVIHYYYYYYYYYYYTYPNYIEEDERLFPCCDETCAQGNREIRCIKRQVLYRRRTE